MPILLRQQHPCNDNNNNAAVPASTSISHPNVAGGSAKNVKVQVQGSRGEVVGGEGGEVVEPCSGGGAGRWRRVEEALMAAAAVEEDAHSRDWRRGFDRAIGEGGDLGGQGAGGGAEMLDGGGADEMGSVPPLRVAPMASLMGALSAGGSGHANIMMEMENHLVIVL